MPRLVGRRETRVVRRRLDLDLDRRGGFGLGGLFVVRGDGFLDGVDDGVFHVLDGVLNGLDGVLDGLGGRGLSLVGGLWGGGKGGGMREERCREREKKRGSDFFFLCRFLLSLRPRSFSFFSPFVYKRVAALGSERRKGVEEQSAEEERERDRERERGRGERKSMEEPKGKKGRQRN